MSFCAWLVSILRHFKYLITYMNILLLFIYSLKKGIKKFFGVEELIGGGDWGLGIGDWGLGIGPIPQSPIPNPQSPFIHQEPEPRNIKYNMKYIGIIIFL